MSPWELEHNWAGLGEGGARVSDPIKLVVNNFIIVFSQGSTPSCKANITLTQKREKKMLQQLRFF